MKTIKILISLLATTLILWSCSKSNKDYVGVYKTQFVMDVKVPNTQTFWASKGFVESPTGFNAVDLGTIQVEFMIDESTKLLNGNGRINIPVAQQMGYSNITKRITVDFDAIAPNIKNDTLFFLIQSVSSKVRIEAYLIIEDDKTYFGMKKKNCSSKANGPQFVKENGEYNQYATNDTEMFTKFDAFIIQQFRSNDSIIMKTTAPKAEKDMLMNANFYYNKMYLKK